MAILLLIGRSRIRALLGLSGGPELGTTSRYALATAAAVLFLLFLVSRLDEGDVYGMVLAVGGLAASAWMAVTTYLKTHAK